MEKIIYECRPHFYFFLACYALTLTDRSSWVFLSGLILFVCSFYVFSVRATYRRRLRLAEMHKETQDRRKFAA